MVRIRLSRREREMELTFQFIDWKQLASNRRRSVKKMLRSATLLKNKLWHTCFPVNFAKFSTNFFSWSTSSGFLWLIAYPALQRGFLSVLKDISCAHDTDQ